MSKRTVFTTITPLPAGISREVVLDFLHDHEEMIDLNPLVKERHPISPPPHASADELGCRWYSLTDKISYLPGGWAEGDVTYTCAFHDLPQGLQTHCYAPAGLTIRDKWSVGGSLPGEPAQKAELGLNIPPTGLYLREDVNMKCNVFMASFVKKTLKKSHAHLVERLKAKAKAVAERGNNNSPARVAADANDMRRGSNAASYTGSGNSYHQYQHQQQQYFTGGSFTNSSRPHSVSSSSLERESNSAASSPSVNSTQMWSPGPQGSVMTVASPPMSLKSPPSGYAPFPATNPPTTPPYPAAGGNNNSQANPPYPVSSLHPPATQPQQTHYRPYGQGPHQLPLIKARPGPAPQHLEPQTPFFQQQQPQDDWPKSSEPSTSISSFISYKKHEPVPQPPAKITNLVPEALRVPAMASSQEKKSLSNDEIWKALGGRAGSEGDSTAAAAAPYDPYKPTAGYGNESTYTPYDKESKPAAYKDGNGSTFAAYNQGSHKNAAPNVNTLNYDYNINSNNIAASVNSLSYGYNSYESRNTKANTDSVEVMNSLSYGLNGLHVQGEPHKSHVRERSYSKGSNVSGDNHPDYPEMNPYAGLLPSQRKQEQEPEVRGPFVSELP